MIKSKLAGLIVLMAAALAGGSSQTPEPQLVPFQPLAGDFEVIHGDIEKTGEPFVMRIKELRGGIVPPHQHPVDEHITILEGTMYLGTGPEFDPAKMKKLGPGGYAFLPKGTMIFGATPDGPATVQVHGIGPFHLHWKYPLQTYESPDAAQAFQYRAGQRIKTKYGVGVIEKGWRSGPVIQYETRVGREVVMANESEVRPVR
ncbi:MAG: cupin domain-containing protein [Acidobacteriota bacterium]|nr:cupin domain-containing protein [Acidobacteriota bacterium]